MGDDAESRTFGFDRGTTLSYHLDNYSTPDDWHYMGYEFQYTFAVRFHTTVRQADRVEFFGILLDVFQGIFGLPHDGHYKLEAPLNMVIEVPLNNSKGVPLDDLTGCGLLLKIFWDKGRFDLRILKRLEDEINNVAILSRATVELISLIIIPRSRETIASKVDGKL